MEIHFVSRISSLFGKQGEFRLFSHKNLAKLLPGHWYWPKGLADFAALKLLCQAILGGGRRVLDRTVLVDGFTNVLHKFPPGQ